LPIGASYRGRRRWLWLRLFGRPSKAELADNRVIHTVAPVVTPLALAVFPVRAPAPGARTLRRQAARPGATAGSAHSIARYAAFSRSAPGGRAPHMDHRLIGSSAPSVAWRRVVACAGPPAPGHAAPALGRHSLRSLGELVASLAPPSPPRPGWPAWLLLGRHAARTACGCCTRRAGRGGAPSGRRAGEQRRGVAPACSVLAAVATRTLPDGADLARVRSSGGGAPRSRGSEQGGHRAQAAKTGLSCGRPISPRPSASTPPWTDALAMGRRLMAIEPSAPEPALRKPARGHGARRTSCLRCERRERERATRRRAVRKGGRAGIRVDRFDHALVCEPA
jgi:hypothetical protein